MSERVLVRLNESLLIQQGISEEQENRLQSLYSKLEYVLSNPEVYEDPVLLIEELEFEIQENWNFIPDRNKHKYWRHIRGCRCPILNNKEYWGTPYRIYNEKCIWHGGINS